MTIEISAFLFSIMTGYVAVRYEGTVTSRIAVVMLLTAAGGSLATEVVGDVTKFNSLLSLTLLIIGHIGSEVISRKVISKNNKGPEGNVIEISKPNDLLSILSSSKDLDLEAELNIKIK